ETDRAIDAEGVLQSNIETVQDNVNTYKTVTETAIADEEARATAAEEKLNADITAQTTRAIDAESVLTAGLSAETARATSAEGILQANIDANQVAAETAIALKEDASN